MVVNQGRDSGNILSELERYVAGSTVKLITGYKTSCSKILAFRP